MTDRKCSSHRIDRARLKPLEAEVFPRNMRVRTDKPGGLVAYDSGLVGFEDTNIVILERQTDRSGGYAEIQEPHIGPLSLVFTRGGWAPHEVDGRRFVIDEGSYLVFNLGQVIGGAPDSPTATETYCIGFWPGFAEEVLHSLITPDDHLLADPRPAHGQPVRFLDQLYPRDSVISPVLTRIEQAMNSPHTTTGRFEELHFSLLEAMLRVHRNVGREIAKLPGQRASTRAELYRRLHRARDFMEANLDQPLTIPQIAQEAWVSPYHFLRQFKQTFDETPHQYLTRRRLDRAQALLLRTEMPVTDVRSAVGFESLGSFSDLFRQRLGMSPQTFRRHHRNMAA